MRPYTKAILVGATVAILLVAAVVAFATTGTLQSLVRPVATDSVLVILVAPDAEGTESAAFAFAVDTADGRVQPVDTSVEKTIPGTSAKTPAGAYPFGGGAIVAASVADQTGGEKLPWVVLPESVWASMVDDDGELSIDVPTQVNVFLGEDLTLLDPGVQDLGGTEVAALAAALGFMDDADRAELKSALEGGLGRVVTSDSGRLAELVRTGAATSSLEDSELDTLDWTAP